MVAYSMSNIWYTLFVCTCLYCVSWWCCLVTGHLSQSWSLTAQGYMLDWLGDVTSTVSFCQLSGGVCYPTNLCIHFMLHVALCQIYGSVKLSIVLFLNVILSMSYFVFCLCFVYKFHYILESVYWFHSTVVPLAYVPVWCCALICQVRSHSELSVTFDQCFMYSVGDQALSIKPLVGIDLL